LNLQKKINAEASDKSISLRLAQVVEELPAEQKRKLLKQLNQNALIEKRKHPRSAFFEKAELSVIKKEKSDFTTNISRGGLFIETDLPFNIGERVELTLRLSGVGEPVRVFGKIARKEEDGIGIQFTKPDPHILEVTPRPKVSKIQDVESKMLESFKVYLQERLSLHLYQKILSFKWKIREFLIPIRKVRYYGHSHYCPVCGSHISRFLLNIANLQGNARCPVCRCLERHRLDWIFFQSKTNLFDGKQKKMLHVAPESIFESKFRKVPTLNYFTADLNNPKAMCNLDITNIPFPDNCFDVIYCSHVLEHVPDDRKALREFLRVLRTGGWALLQVPITAEKTFENPSIIDPFERKRLFGQIDHVRRYGPDYKERLEEAGFKTKVLSAGSVLKNKNDFLRFAIQENRMIFYCMKQ